MTSGIFCVWSTDDPVPKKPEAKDVGAEGKDTGSGAVFADHITALEGVEKGSVFEPLEEQPYSKPHTLEDEPFVTMYELPNVDVCQQSAFKDKAESIQSPPSLPPRAYKLLETFEADDCAGVNPPLNSLRILLSIGHPPPPLSTSFWSYVRDDMTPNLMAETPELLRVRFFEALPSASASAACTAPEPSVHGEAVASPYLFDYELDCEDVPWDGLLGALSTEGFAKHFEDSGLRWEAMWCVFRRSSVGERGGGKEEEGEDGVGDVGMVQV